MVRLPPGTQLVGHGASCKNLVVPLMIGVMADARRPWYRRCEPVVGPGHVIPTSLLRALLTSTIGAPVTALGLIEG